MFVCKKTEEQFEKELETHLYKIKKGDLSTAEKEVVLIRL